jgi:glycolate oxidase iron-sulfur subunit
MLTRERTQEIDGLLRRCVECGLCLPHCATYLVSGDETLSPRGRLLLLGEIAHGRLEAEVPAVARAFDLCLGCMACSAVCPSGVSNDLLVTLRDLGQRASRRPGRRAVGWLDRAAVLRLVRAGGTAARALLVLLLGTHWRRRLQRSPAPLARLARLLGILPTAPRRDRGLVTLLDRLVACAPVADTARLPAVPPAAGSTLPSATPPSPTGATSAAVAADATAATTATAAATAAGAALPLPGPRLAWFAGCADQMLLPGTADRLRRLLGDLGCSIVEPRWQACCGALAAHAARPRRSRWQRRRNTVAFGGVLDQCDHVVVAAAGCSLHLLSYPDPFGRKVQDAIALLDRLLPASLGTLPLRVAVHDPCHRRHGLQMVAEPRRLLARIDGLQILEPAEAEVCCGSAGTYAVEHADLAAAMSVRKAAVLAATGCDLVVTTNSGCLGQIADGLALVAPHVPVLPLTDLLWYAWSRRPGAQERVAS